MCLLQEPADGAVDLGCSASVDTLHDELAFAGEEAAAAEHANLPWIGHAVAAEHPHLQTLLVCKAVTRQAVPAALFLHHPFSQTTSVVLPKGATPILLHEVILVPAEDQLVVTAEANSSRLKVDMFIPSALSWDTLKTMQKWKLQELVYVPAHTELPPRDCCLIMRHLAAMVKDGCAEGAEPDELHGVGTTPMRSTSMAQLQRKGLRLQSSLQKEPCAPPTPAVHGGYLSRAVKPFNLHS